ncbi:DUF262 domain-containing protein [Vreelandella alkaliphila]|uniref:DUF262 domain-containing protein n=1 Tax=Vreelandella alkaliphila TaxID=272774 RepID=UPI00232FC92D|nr:DUF262 domain-containing HNH endonuclease family protein [Halomonas alkaliphila]
MENGQKKLSELFGGHKVFNIPDYQRAYAWDDTRQLPEFLEDIENQTLGRDYFLGTILFQEKGKKGNFEWIDVVDGQQRITTAIIFMKALLTELKDRITEEEYEEAGLYMLEEAYIQYRKTPKLRVISSDNDFFSNYVLNGGDGKDYITTPSQRRLYKARMFFENELAGRPVGELLELMNKLDEYTKVLTYSVNDTAEATLIFETTNDRGKGLTNLEKIKSFLMYKVYLASGEDVDAYLDSIQVRFADIYRDLESLDGKTDEDKILQYHCIAFESWSDKEDYQQPVSFVKKKVNSLLRKGEGDKGKAGQEASRFIMRFSQELRESFQLMSGVLKSRNAGLLNLMHLDRMGSFYPLLLKTYKFDKSENKENFDKVCRLLEIFVFRVFVIHQSRSLTGQSRLYRMARDFSGKFAPLFDRLAELTDTSCSMRMFKDDLAYEAFYEVMGSRDISYLMWNYENHLRATENPVCAPMPLAELKGKDSKTRLTVEHIAAQTQKESGTIVKEPQVLPRIGEKFIENHLHRLGNLTFDPASANSSKGNKQVKEKNSKYFSKAPYKTQNELESFLDKERWTAKSIKWREEKIVNFCMKRWCTDYIDEPLMP